MKSKEDIQKILNEVESEFISFSIGERKGSLYLQGRYIENDTFTKVPAWQKTRKWLLSEWMTTSEIVQTALACLMASMEHRARESFHYKGKRVFGPHMNVEELVEISEKLDVRPPLVEETPKTKEEIVKSLFATTETVLPDVPPV